MNQFADDLAKLLESLNISDAVLIGHSMGGGEIVRYAGRHGLSRVRKMVLISAVPPIMLRSENNPMGSPISVFDSLREGVAGDRSQFYKDTAVGFYGSNRPAAKVSQGLAESFWLQGMMSSAKASYDCISEFSETNFTEDLKKIDVPCLVLHGDDDQIVPIAAAGLRSAKILQNAELKIYPGGSHGLVQTEADSVNEVIKRFIQS